LYHRARLLRDHIDEPYFNALRTEKQLAYYLAVKVQNVRGVLGLQFLLVSSTKDAYDISVEIKNFVKEFFGNLVENLNEEKLTQLKNSVETKIITPHNNLKDLNSFVNREISCKTFNFNRKTKE
jgi:secreted Zn-dependent insulinase-like peptidase